MVKIRVIYDDDRELAEVIRLLSSRLNYCRRYPEDDPKRCFLGIKTDDLLVDLVNEKADEANKSVDFREGTPIDCTKGGMNDECDQRL